MHYIRTEVRLDGKMEDRAVFTNGSIFYDYSWKTTKEYNDFFNIEDWSNSDKDKPLKAGAI